jgi:NAD+ synthase (glutamine-hydrolysing)
MRTFAASIKVKTKMKGYVKVAAASPLTEIANCEANVQRIESLVRKADNAGVQIIVFPELCVTAYTCMDLFAHQYLLSNARQALLQLVENTRDMDIFCVVGMPFSIENKLLNCAVAFQKGRISGIVPKTYIPNCKEFQEMRWFTSGSRLQAQTIRIGNEEYPIGTDLLFRADNINIKQDINCSGNIDNNIDNVGGNIDNNFNINGNISCDINHDININKKLGGGGVLNSNKSYDSLDVVIGIEICEDLWTPVPPSSLFAMNGANIILNLSASNEIISKHRYLRSLVAQQSARCISAYVYASAGFGESSTDLVFTGKGFIAENGTIISESERFNLEDKFITNDVHIDYLHHDRLENLSFMPPSGKLAPVRFIPFELPPYKGIFQRNIDPHPFVPAEGLMLRERCEEILNIQTMALVRRLRHIGCSTVVVGISGGLDSTLALMVTVMAFDMLGLPRENIIGVTMPGFGTTGRTHHNAIELIKSLKVGFMEISIKEACIRHFKDIGHDGITPDVTYENTQARERTQILMDLANKTGGIVIGTGDLSELALGWTTFNGDHISMYAVNAGIPKTLVRYLIEWTAHNVSDERTQRTLLDVAATPISPELTPADESGNIRQKTEDIIGPYELHDFFLYHFIRFGASPEKILLLAHHAFNDVYSEDEISKWLKVFLRRFFSQQFKRNCLPDGPKVGTISLSPRSDWRMAGDASVKEIISDWRFDASVKDIISQK